MEKRKRSTNRKGSGAQTGKLCAMVPFFLMHKYRAAVLVLVLVLILVLVLVLVPVLVILTVPGI